MADEGVKNDGDVLDELYNTKPMVYVPIPQAILEDLLGGAAADTAAGTAEGTTASGSVNATSITGASEAETTSANAGSQSLSLNIDSKIESQMSGRGWDGDSIQETVDQPYTTREAFNKATGNDATAYFNKDGSYVTIDNVTKEVVQISNKNDLNWIPDNSIKNPYRP